jgi:hypothetical protein
MKCKETIIGLLMGAWLAVVAGCGKTENATPPSKDAETTTKAEKAAPAVSAEKLAEQSTNAATAAVETAKAAVDAAVKTADTTVTPLQEPAPAATTSPGLAGQAKASLAGLSQDQMVKGLQEALAKGLQQAIAGLGHDGGFLTNLGVKIPMPQTLQKVETVLRTMKQEKLADDFVTTMNHAAEQAVPEAGSVFADVLKQMNIEDAKSILSGADDAATQYFQKATQTNLYARFYPIVQTATQKTGVTAAYKNLMDKAKGGQALGGLGNLLGGSALDKDSLDIDAYVTNQAMAGLFKMVAVEEKQIRQNPVARTTDTLQKVFGALTR